MVMAYTDKPKDFFAKLEKLAARGPLLEGVGTVSFDIQGEDGGAWLVDFSSGRVTIARARATRLRCPFDIAAGIWRARSVRRSFSSSSSVRSRTSPCARGRGTSWPSWRAACHPPTAS